MKEDGFNLNIVIVGLGLIGGSYAMALKELKPSSICGIDLNRNSLDEALRRGIIDEGYTDGAVALKKADLIIMALYPKDTIKFIKNNINNFKDKALITDTCGIKEEIINEINSFLPENLEFIGGHPMAGKESQGFKVASKDIFKNANYIITPTKKNNKLNIKLIEKMAKAIGCKNIINVEPKEHDNMIALTSQLPHALAVALMNSDKSENDIELFTGGSFKDATRVAIMNSELWSELFVSNSHNLIKQIENFEKAMKEIKSAIISEDKVILNEIFENATIKRKKMI